MPELISKPDPDWSIELKCKGSLGCKHVYRYFAHEVHRDVFKISGHFFDGSAKTRDLAYVRCGHCRKLIQLPNRPPKRIWDNPTPDPD